MQENDTLTHNETKKIKRTVSERLLGIGSRVFVWSTLFFILYALRSFFLLIFLTFVFAYIQSRLVNRLEPRLKSRRLSSIFASLVMVGVIILAAGFIVPKVANEAQMFVEKFPSYIGAIDRELIKIEQNYPSISSFLAFTNVEHEFIDGVGQSRAAGLLHAGLNQLLGKGQGSGENIRYLLSTTRNIGSTLLGFGSAFLLSLLFSFLIVLDLPKLSNAVKGLAQTKLRFVYREVAGSIHSFGKVMGQALEAQLFIALLNTCLTAIGLWILGLSGKVAFLSLIVFLCSFIPVAGVFISSLPICLVALQQGGWFLAFVAACYIIIIHMIEAYILNPKIYGQHLHMNPVIVLIILTVGGKMFGVWGLVLGVPLCTYLFGHAIRYQHDHKNHVI